MKNRKLLKRSFVLSLRSITELTVDSKSFQDFNSPSNSIIFIPVNRLQNMELDTLEYIPLLFKDIKFEISSVQYFLLQFKVV